MSDQESDPEIEPTNELPPEIEGPERKVPVGGLSPIIAGVLGALFVGNVLVMIELIISGREPTDVTLGALLVSFAGTWLGLAPAIAWSAGWNLAGLRERLAFRIAWKDIPIGVGLGLVGQFVVLTLVYLPLQLLSPDTYDSLGDPARDLTDSFGVGFVSVTTLILVVCIGAPFIEELFFRGVVLRSVAARWNVKAGVAVSAVLFGLVHMQPLQTPGLIAFGLLLAWVTAKSGRLGPSIFAHMTFNALTVFALLTA